jgi:hypothetical protein
VAGVLLQWREENRAPLAGGAPAGEPAVHFRMHISNLGMAARSSSCITEPASRHTTESPSRHSWNIARIRQDKTRRLRFSTSPSSCQRASFLSNWPP